MAKKPRKRKHDPEKALPRKIIEKILSEPLGSEEQDGVDTRITEEDKRRAEAGVRDLVLELKAKSEDVSEYWEAWLKRHTDDAGG